MVLVAAGTYNQAEGSMKVLGIKDWRYVGDYYGLLSLKDCTLWLVGGYALGPLGPHMEEVRDYCKTHNITIRRKGD